MARSRFLPDNFTLTLVGMVVLASILPVSGQMARVFDGLTTAAITLLFFLHGARLSREAVVAGISHWRLHLIVLASTFVLFPLLGLALEPVFTPMLPAGLFLGVLYLCVLPSTVQSSIALTSMARGNVPAAVCSASASTLLGVFITPLLVNLLVVPGGNAGASLEAIGRIFLQLLLPFVAGHLLRLWIGGFVKRHAASLKYVDQGSIVLVVYTAFSAAVIEGLWREVSIATLMVLLFACAVVLAVVLSVTTWVARRRGFSVEDEITIVFCGSKKSLASGAPMAKVLFAAPQVGAILLPVMLFHQMQLMVCALLAQRYARRPEPVDPAPVAGSAQ